MVVSPLDISHLQQLLSIFSQNRCSPAKLADAKARVPYQLIFMASGLCKYIHPCQHQSEPWIASVIPVARHPACTYRALGSPCSRNRSCRCSFDLEVKVFLNTVIAHRLPFLQSCTDGRKVRFALLWNNGYKRIWKFIKGHPDNPRRLAK